MSVREGAVDGKVVAIVPCLNEAAHIEGVLDQLLRDPALQGSLVVVADGGSQDGTREIVHAYAERDGRVRLLPNPKKLQSAGVNLAAERFGADAGWIIRIDAHAGYPEAYVSTLLRVAGEQGADSVVVSMDTQGRGCFQKAAAAAQNSALGAGGSSHRRLGVSGWVDHGHHALFRREAFVAVGGYDETFSHNEDAELDVRLAARGARIWLTDQAALVYYPRSTPQALWRQYLNYGRGRARTVLKHRMRLKPRQAAPLAVAPAAVLALAAPVHPIFAVPALLWISACLGVGLLVGAKNRSVCACGSGVAAMVMHLAWSLGFWRQLFAGRRAAPAASDVAQAAAT